MKKVKELNELTFDDVKVLLQTHKEAIELLNEARGLLNGIPNRRILWRDRGKYKDTYEFLSVLDKLFRDNKL
jgi:hypothetical protein